MRIKQFKIQEEKNVFSDHFLDIIGGSFKFDHARGLSEWLKNSIDAYNRKNVPDEYQHVVFRFNDKTRKSEASIECIDFAGMTSSDIVEAFKKWGDPDAAKRGLRILTYGGHGNGGKFYMREMFKASHFVTYAGGKLNIYGFTENKRYGFANGFKDRLTSPPEALKFADLDFAVLPNYLKKLLLLKKTGFTVVRGLTPLWMPNRINAYDICEKLRHHSQARRILNRIPSAIYYNGKVIYDRLLPDELKPYPGFEKPLGITIPPIISYEERGRTKQVSLVDEKYTQGKLILRTSEIALERGGKFADFSTIDILGEQGVIASYPVNELGRGLQYPQTVFIYGECKCPILEDPSMPSVTNERIRLVADSPRAKGLLFWINEQVDKLAREIAEKEKKETTKKMEKISSAYNNFLNDWKNKFMNRIFVDIFKGRGSGGFARSGSGIINTFDKGGLRKKRRKSGFGEGGNDEKIRAKRFPKVLLSDRDDDPLNPGNPLPLQPRHPAVYQRPQDVKEGIYWINTSTPFASAILQKYGDDSVRWRDYLFDRYVDIMVKDVLRELEKREPERFNTAGIEAKIYWELIPKIYEAAAKDLDRFLFAEHFEPSKT